MFRGVFSTWWNWTLARTGSVPNSCARDFRFLFLPVFSQIVFTFRCIRRAMNHYIQGKRYKDVQNEKKNRCFEGNCWWQWRIFKYMLCTKRLPTIQILFKQRIKMAAVLRTPILIHTASWVVVITGLFFPVITEYGLVCIWDRDRCLQLKILAFLLSGSLLLRLLN